MTSIFVLVRWLLLLCCEVCISRNFGKKNFYSQSKPVVLLKLTILGTFEFLT